MLFAICSSDCFSRFLFISFLLINVFVFMFLPGEGVPDLLKMIITLSQNRLTEQLMYMELLQCTVLEVKVIEGLGHTVDVVLVNGTLKEGKRRAK